MVNCNISRYKQLCHACGSTCRKCTKYFYKAGCRNQTILSYLYIGYLQLHLLVRLCAHVCMNILQLLLLHDAASSNPTWIAINTPCCHPSSFVTNQVVPWCRLEAPQKVTVESYCSVSAIFSLLANLPIPHATIAAATDDALCGDFPGQTYKQIMVLISRHGDPNGNPTQASQASLKNQMRRKFKL